MAGRNIREYLSTTDYDHFYDLYHTMAETMGSTLSVIQTAYYVMGLLSSQHPEVFPDPATRTELEAFSLLSKELGVKVSNFFWPGTRDARTDAEHRSAVRFSVERWQPYDEPAWDNMFAQMIAQLHPFMQSAGTHCKTINSYSLGESPKADDVKNILMVLGQKLDDLTRLCNQDEVETFFRFRPRQA